MKREAFRHPKMFDLAARLGVPKYAAIGLLDELWNWVPDVALAGDIGRWTDGVIANAIGWTGDASLLIEALVASGWLDRDDDYRLVVHDWAQHCENWVRAKAEKTGVVLLGQRSTPARRQEEPKPAKTAKSDATPLKSEPDTPTDATTQDADSRGGLKSGSPPRDQTKPNLSNPPPPPSGPPAGVPKGWEEEEAGLRRLGVSLSVKAIRSAIEHGFTAPQVAALIEHIESNPPGCTAPHGAIFNRLVTQGADAVNWMADQNWPWSQKAANGSGSPYVPSDKARKVLDEQRDRERDKLKAERTAKIFALETQWGDRLNALDEDSLLSLLAGDAIRIKAFRSKGRDSPDVRPSLLERLAARETSRETAPQPQTQEA